jgi:hypothetical protein
VPTPQPTTQPTVAPTIDPALAAEILPAYQHYWEVLDDALSTLDDSKLKDVMDGPELVGTQSYVSQLENQNRALVGPEDHAVTVVSATPEEAVIHDHVVDHSVVIDATTRQPLPPDQQQKQGTEIDGTYYLRNIDGTWKVVGES